MLAAAGAGLAGLGLWGWLGRRPAPLSAEALAALQAVPLPPIIGPMRVYHLGHSLVGRDMPAMLEQLAGAGSASVSQLGWGASLRQHWRGEVPGFDTENAHPAHLPAREALAAGGFDAVVLTEMVEIRDAIRYHDSARYLAHWAAFARAADPDVRLYLYETWHRRDDPEGWLERIDADLARYWQGEVLRPAMARDGVGTIYLIPAGQVLAAVVRKIEAGGVPGLAARADLFSVGADGAPDLIHLNDIGAYLVALTHWAVLRQQSPVGLPHALRRADGTAATALSPAAAAVLQAVVWQVVSGYAGTGIARDKAGSGG